MAGPEQAGANPEAQKEMAELQMIQKQAQELFKQLQGGDLSALEKLKALLAKLQQMENPQAQQLANQLQQVIADVESKINGQMEG